MIRGEWKILVANAMNDFGLDLRMGKIDREADKIYAVEPLKLKEIPRGEVCPVTMHIAEINEFQGFMDALYDLGLRPTKLAKVFGEIEYLKEEKRAAITRKDEK